MAIPPDPEGKPAEPDGQDSDPTGRERTYILWMLGFGVCGALGVFFLLSGTRYPDYVDAYKGIGRFLVGLGVLGIVGVLVGRFLPASRRDNRLLKIAGVTAFSIITLTGFVFVFPGPFYGSDIAKSLEDTPRLRGWGFLWIALGIFGIVVCLRGWVPGYLQVSYGTGSRHRTRIVLTTIAVCAILVSPLLFKLGRMEETDHEMKRMQTAISQSGIQAEYRIQALGAESAGDYSAAEKFQRKALSAGEEAWGRNSPLICDDLRDLAVILFQEGKDEEARDLYRRWISIVGPLVGAEKNDLQEGTVGFARFTKPGRRHPDNCQDQTERLRLEYQELMRK